MEEHRPKKLLDQVRDASRTTTERAWDRSGLPKPRVDAMMQAAQGKSIVEKQPNSRMCFVCGIENPIGLKLRFCTED